MLQTFTYSTDLSACGAPARRIQLGARPRSRKLHARRCSRRTVRCDAMTVQAATAIDRLFAPAPAGDRRPSASCVSRRARPKRYAGRSDRCSPARRSPDTRGSARDRAHCVPKISAQRVRRGLRRRLGANHPTYRFARVRSRIRSRARFRDALVKKIFNSPKSPLCDRSREHRGEKISRRARAPMLAPRIATARKPLCHADFCVTRRNAPLVSSLRPEKSCAR